MNARAWPRVEIVRPSLSLIGTASLRVHGMPQRSRFATADAPACRSMGRPRKKGGRRLWLLVHPRRRDSMTATRIARQRATPIAAATWKVGTFAHDWPGTWVGAPTQCQNVPLL